MRRAVIAALCVVAIVACGDDLPITPSDGGVDAAPDAAMPGVIAPAGPAWICPDGWAPTPLGACEPWSVDASECPDGEVRFVGDDACTTPGGTCPLGDFAEGISATGTIIHVRAGEPPGGDGSITSPRATIADALSRAAPGDVVSLAKGTYDAIVRLPGGVRIVGACAAETLLTTPRPHDFEGVVTLIGPDAGLSRLTISGARAGVWVDTHSVVLEDIVVDGATGFGLLASFGGRISGADVVVRSTEQRGGRLGVGLTAGEGGSIDLDRVIISDNIEVGATAVGEGSMLSLRRARITGTRTSPTGRIARGIAAQRSGRVSLTSSLVDNNADTEILGIDGAELLIEETVVRGSELAATTGRGIQVLTGSSATLSRVLVEGAVELGIAAAGEGTTIDLEDAVVRGTRAAPDGTSGNGVLLDAGAVGTLRRVVLETNRDAALLVRGATTTLDVTDLRVRGTRSAEYDGSGGRGIEANSGATLMGERIALIENREAGLVAFDEGTRVDLVNLKTSDTRERACAVDVCAGSGAGMGVVAVRGATLTILSFLIERSALAGAQMVGADLSLADGEVRDNPIGVNLQDTALTLEDVTTDVRFVDNERNFDAAMLWVPQAGR